MDNPYEVVRQDKTTRVENGIRYEDIRGYDKQGRLVLISTYISYPDGKEGHFIRCVNERGYWEGGAYDPITDTHMSLPLEPFEEVNL